MKRIWTFNLAFALTFLCGLCMAREAVASPCEICHYWSEAACYDACNNQDPTNACYACCWDSCGNHTGTNPYEGSGGNGGGTGTDDPHLPGSPIVIPADTGSLRFTSIEDGVEFDLDADGDPEAMAWTAAGSGVAFLVLDRNFDGRIDSGLELFGNYTAQPPAAEPNGFLALAVFDAPEAGGNGDGAISSADAVWTNLRLWLDNDQNGLSGPQELTSLAENGVASIDLAFHESRRKDRFGNELRYHSRVLREGPPTLAVDVFLRRLP